MSIYIDFYGGRYDTPDRQEMGNSPAVRLPTVIVEAAHLTPGQAVEVRIENGRIV
jgi:antitoxin component of MazEF toxin-antitoxin module